MVVRLGGVKPVRNAQNQVKLLEGAARRVKTDYVYNGHQAIIFDEEVPLRVFQQIAWFYRSGVNEFRV